MELVLRKIDKMMELQKVGSSSYVSRSAVVLPEVPSLDVTILLSLPDHLRKSAIALSSLKEGTATDLSKSTGRVRAVESDYLNQLVSMGLIKKKRRGRDVYFSIDH